MSITGWYSTGKRTEDIKTELLPDFIVVPEKDLATCRR
jgi:hypothetical protein